MDTIKRIRKVRELMKNGVPSTKMAVILGVEQQVINEDILWLNRELLRLGLRIGDWVVIERDSPTTMPCDGKLGRIVQVRLSAGEVGVDLRPLSDTPWEQLFEIADIRKLNEMEVLAKASV